MKKLTALLLALLMLVSCAWAEDAADPESDDNVFLTQEELEMYLSVLLGDALAFGADHTEYDPQTGETTVIYAENAALYIADEELTESSAVVGAMLNEAQEDLRGLHLGDPVTEVLAIYPNDNPELDGTFYDATLYVNDERPQASVGYILREGQRVSEVTHLVFTWSDTGVVRCGITYQIDQGAVCGIRIFGLGTIVEEEDALEEIANVAQMQENREYAAFPVSYTGENMEPFNENDLIFSGIDFLNLTNEGAVALLSETPVDDWLEDSTGEWLRTRQWDDLSVVFRYDAQRNFLAVDSLIIDTDLLDGPRGVRVDDTMDSVMNRFLQGENVALENNSLALYGDGQTAPYAVLAYGEKTVTLTYALRTMDQRDVIWNLTFVDGMLQSHRMLLR